MKKTEYYNNLSEKTLKAIKLDKPVRIKMAVSEYDDEGKEVYPRSKAISMTDVITDPDTGKDVAIAVIDGVKPDGEPIIGSFHFEAKHMGFRTLNPTSQKDREIIQFLMLTDYNGSKEGRDTSKEIQFTVYNPEAIATEQNKAELKRAEAIVFIQKTMKAADVRKFATSKGWDDTMGLAELRKKILVYAKGNESQFFAEAKPEVVKRNSIIRKAEGDGVIYFDTQASAWGWKASGDSFMTVSRTSKQNRYNQLLNWIDTTEEGQAIYEDLAKSTGMTK